MADERDQCDDGGVVSRKAPAAEYVRMSTEHQQYSTDNQVIAIRRYAERCGFEIIRRYADEGKSGLDLAGRPALQRLLNDIDLGRADFHAVLVYDVSRLGRFQDPDEAASCELRCRRAGVAVHYCAEQFENDGSMGSAIIKTVKRAMAGEYSRELSVKVFVGQANIVSRGFSPGGVPGYGLRRLLVDRDGEHKAVLRPGEHKSIGTDRVILVPGPDDEVRIVRAIFRLYVEEELTPKQIAEWLNGQQVLNELGRKWLGSRIRSLLRNQKYIGNIVWNRTSDKLRQRRVHLDPEAWIRAEGACKPLVDKSIFDRAQERLAARARRLTDEEVIDQLRNVLAHRGTLSSPIITSSDAQSVCALRARFGSLLSAYRLAGFVPCEDYRNLRFQRMLGELRPRIISEAIDGLRGLGGTAKWDPGTGVMTINEEFTASIAILRCDRTVAGTLYWRLRLSDLLIPDILVAVRMNADNTCVRDYYLFPRLALSAVEVRLWELNEISLDAYRSDTLTPFYQMAARRDFRRAA